MNRRALIKAAIPLSSIGLLNSSWIRANFASPDSMRPLIADKPIEVINAGVGGNNTYDLLNRLKEDCLNHNPGLVILMVGTNDMNSLKNVSFPQFEKNLQKIITDLLHTKSKVLLLTILPFYEPYLLTRHRKEFYEPEGPNGRKQMVNKIIEKVAREKRVHYLDIGLRFSAIGKIGLDKESLIRNEANSDKQDGVHPTSNGYRFLALSVYDYLSAKKINAKKIVCLGDSITQGESKGENYPSYLSKLFNGE